MCGETILEPSSNGCRLPGRRKAVLALAGVLLSGMAMATEFRLDAFTVVVNGTTVFVDNFDDGSPPPNSPGAFSYLVTGGFSGETNGFLLSNPAQGAPSTTPTGRPARIQAARLLTPTDPGLPSTLGTDDTFTVSALYDLVNPGAASERYRVTLTDRVGPQGAGDQTNNVLHFGVERAADGQYAGQTVLRFRHADFKLDDVQLLAEAPVDFAGAPDQIRLSLSKANAASGLVTASYQYLKAGSVIGDSVFATTPAAYALFDGEVFTRGEFSSLLIPDAGAPNIVAQLTTGSPVSLSQVVDTPASPFNLEFDYQFKTLTGQLQVLLNGAIVGTLDAPALLGVDFETASFLIDGPLLSLSDVALEFRFGGPTGSTVLLDNILFPGLANGDFQSGNLSGFQVSGPGTAQALTIASVSSPGVLALLVPGLVGCWAQVGTRRRTRSSGHFTSNQLPAGL